MNDKIYIHEFIHITKQNRARYMHHMTANWSPIAQEQRHQLCYGVWGVVGSTGPWPQTVNMWEEDGFDGLASSFGLEFGNRILQDPALEKWWAAAADLRSGGFDRIVVPHPRTRTIEQLCADGAGGEVYAHELVTVPDVRQCGVRERLGQLAALVEVPPRHVVVHLDDVGVVRIEVERLPGTSLGLGRLVA